MTMGTSLRKESSMIEGLIQDFPEAVPAEAKEMLRELPIKYEDVFSMTEGDLERTTVCKHKIDMGKAKPDRKPLRRQPLQYKDAIDKQLDQMLE